MTSVRVTSFAQFVLMVRERLDLNIHDGDLREGSRLSDDLGFDSLAHLELLYLIEDIAGRAVEFSEAREEWTTLGDAYGVLLRTGSNINGERSWGALGLRNENL